MSDLLANLGNGFGNALTLANLAAGFAGVVLGTVVGVLPGLGPSVAISLLLPVTFGLDPTTAFILFGGIYYGSMYGGAITAILINTPGDASAAVTTIDGYQMARSGRAGPALATSMIGSFVAGTVGTVLLMLLAPVLVNAALIFGPPEYFALMLLALACVGSLGGQRPAKAAVAVSIGLFIAMIGIDLQTGVSRFTFGLPHLASGIGVVVAAIGLFAVGEVLWMASQHHTGSQHVTAIGRVTMSREDWRRSWPAWLRGSLLGFGTGILPGTGGTFATFLSYGVERSVSRRPQEFGRGAIEGVAGPEAANNACAAGAMVPLLGLGIPGSATTAVMLAAFQMYGITPGPLLFGEQPVLVWTLIASLYLANVLLLVLNLPLVGIWVRILTIPRPMLAGAVVLFALVGTYSLNGSRADVVTVCVLGALGFALRYVGLSLGPVLLGVVLGPLIEQEFRRALAISGGSLAVFVTRPIALGILLLGALILLIPFLLSRRREKGGRLSAEGAAQAPIRSSESSS
jgi:putative tricarboxylic transport membrane protein